MIPITPNLSLESRQAQMDLRRIATATEYHHLSRADLILVVEILRSDCDRLRRELDDAKGVIR